MALSGSLSASAAAAVQLAAPTQSVGGTEFSRNPFTDLAPYSFVDADTILQGSSAPGKAPSPTVLGYYISWLAVQNMGMVCQALHAGNLQLVDLRVTARILLELAGHCVTLQGDWRPISKVDCRWLAGVHLLSAFDCCLAAWEDQGKPEFPEQSQVVAALELLQPHLGEVAHPQDVHLEKKVP